MSSDTHALAPCARTSYTFRCRSSSHTYLFQIRLNPTHSKIDRWASGRVPLCSLVDKCALGLLPRRYSGRCNRDRGRGGSLARTAYSDLCWSLPPISRPSIMRQPMHLTVHVDSERVSDSELRRMFSSCGDMLVYLAIAPISRD